MYMNQGDSITCDGNERGKGDPHDGGEERECSDLGRQRLGSVGSGVAQHARSDRTHCKEQHRLHGKKIEQR